jgi:hypothetical protein
MSKTKSTRTWIAALVAVCLLFSQMTVAAYVCPQGFKSSNLMAEESMVSMVDCEAMATSAMDPAKPQLCKAHCESGSQSSNTQNGTDLLLPSWAVQWSLIWMLQAATEPQGQMIPVAHATVRPSASPPLYLVHQVFRL